MDTKERIIQYYQNDINNSIYFILRKLFVRILDDIDEEKEAYIKKIAKSDFMCDIPYTILPIVGLEISFCGSIRKVANDFLVKPKDTICHDIKVEINNGENCIECRYNMFSSTHHLEHCVNIIITEDFNPNFYENI